MNAAKFCQVARRSRPALFALIPVSSFSTTKIDVNALRTEIAGKPGTLNYRLKFTSNRRALSPWHSIPLFGTDGKLLNFVCEISRGSRGKMEVATKEKYNPIKQDVKKGNLRFYGIDPVFNYGMLPQTWENPNVKNHEVNAAGDNDPIDLVEIGGAIIPSGSVLQVKALGVLCLLDEGEVDWKVIGINVNNAKAKLVNDIHDVENVFPGKVAAVREWFRTYKTHEGKPLNKFGLDEKAMDRTYTMGVIEETYKAWKDLTTGHVDPKGLSLAP